MAGMKLPGTHDARTTRPEGVTALANSLHGHLVVGGVHDPEDGEDSRCRLVRNRQVSDIGIHPTDPQAL